MKPTMTNEQIIKQLEKLIDDREAFCISDPEYDEIYIKDIEALKAAIVFLKNAAPIAPHKTAAKIINHYGAQHQLVKLCEECAELTQQAAKCYDKGIPYSDDMIEEIADVLVMIEQFKAVMSQPARDLFEDQIVYKLRRQLDRIEEKST